MKIFLWILSFTGLVYFIGVLMAKYQIDHNDKNGFPEMTIDRGNMWKSWFGYPTTYSRIVTDPDGTKHYYMFNADGDDDSDDDTEIVTDDDMVVPDDSYIADNSQVDNGGGGSGSDNSGGGDSGGSGGGDSGGSGGGDNGGANYPTANTQANQPVANYPTAATRVPVYKSPVIKSNIGESGIAGAGSSEDTIKSGMGTSQSGGSKANTSISGPPASQQRTVRKNYGLGRSGNASKSGAMRRR